MAQGYDKSASALLKEASLDKKKVSSSSVDNLSEIFSAYKSTKKAKVVAKDSSSSSDSDSSSEDEAPKKPIVAKVVAKKAESSDSDSSSDSEVEAPKKVAVSTKPAAKKAASSSSDSSSSDSSDDEAPKKIVVATKATPVKATPVKKAASSSSSSSSDSSSEDEAPPKKVAKKADAPAFTPSTPKAATVVSDSDGKEHKIYVKGLPWLASEAEVRDFFKGCGTILSTECPMGEDGRSSGTAFVKFSKRSELDAAVALDGQLWPGTERWLKIQEGADKPNRSSFGGAEVGERPEGCDTVFVGNLPWDVEEEQMREIFSAAGEVSSVRFATGEDGGFRGFGHVSFYDGNHVDEAVKLAGTQLNGRAIRVDFAPPRNRESAGGRGGRGDGGRGRGDGGRGRGGRDGGRGGRGTPNATVSKAKGSIAVSAGKKMTFDE